MRKLNTSDIFALCRLIKATDAREQLRSIVTSAAKRDDAEEPADLTQIGVDGILAIVEAVVEPKAEALVYQFLAGPMECTPDDVRNMSLQDLTEGLKEIAAENNLTDFFGSASSILGKN